MSGRSLVPIRTSILAALQWKDWISGQAVAANWDTPSKLRVTADLGSTAHRAMSKTWSSNWLETLKQIQLCLEAEILNHSVTALQTLRRSHGGLLLPLSKRPASPELPIAMAACLQQMLVIILAIYSATCPVDTKSALWRALTSISRPPGAPHNWQGEPQSNRNRQVIASLQPWDWGPIPRCLLISQSS